MGWYEKRKLADDKDWMNEVLFIRRHKISVFSIFPIQHFWNLWRLKVTCIKKSKNRKTAHPVSSVIRNNSGTYPTKLQAYVWRIQETIQALDSHWERKNYLETSCCQFLAVWCLQIILLQITYKHSCCFSRNIYMCVQNRSNVIRNKILLTEMQMKLMISIIEERSWQWLGHVLQMTHYQK